MTDTYRNLKPIADRDVAPEHVAHWNSLDDETAAERYAEAVQHLAAERQRYWQAGGQGRYTPDYTGRGAALHFAIDRAYRQDVEAPREQAQREDERDAEHRAEAQAWSRGNVIINGEELPAKGMPRFILDHHERIAARFA